MTRINQPGQVSTGSAPAQSWIFIRQTPPPPPASDGQIDGRIINDLNGNGVQDGGEPFLRDPGNSCNGDALAGVTVSWSGSSSGSTTANLCNSGGPSYHVGNLPAGTYTLSVAVPVGWQVTRINQPGQVSAGTLRLGLGRGRQAS